jgi:5'-nucleotidase
MVVKSRIILVDQDDVIARYKARFFEIWKKKHPERPQINPYSSHKPYIEELYESKQDRRRIEAIMTKKGFFKSIKPEPGAIKALHEMATLGHQVFICTSPLLYIGGRPVMNLNCESEKREWIYKHLKAHRQNLHVIITTDKTLVRGDFLIDDNPSPRGLLKPSWEHILYDRSYNKNVKNLRRLNWSNWKTILPELVK